MQHPFIVVCCDVPFLALKINSMNELIINRCALWQPKNIDELTVREYPAGRVYFENNIAQTSNGPLYRYAKNYEKNGNKFCLFVVTMSNSEKLVERWLDDVADKLGADTIKGAVAKSTNQSFTYLDCFYEGSK